MGGKFSSLLNFYKAPCIHSGLCSGLWAGYGRAMGGLCAGQQLHSIPAQMLMFTMAMPRATRFFATMAKSWDAVLPVASPERARSCSAGDR